MNIANCSHPRYAVQPATVAARAQYNREQERESNRQCRVQVKKRTLLQGVKALMPQGFPTNYAQLVVSVFFLGSFLGENVINPVAAVVGKRPAAIAVTAIFAAAAIIISQMNAQAMTTVVKVLQTMAIFAGVVSLVYSIYGGANVVPFHELVNSGAAAKNLLLILLFGIVLGTHSAQIKQTLSTVFDVKHSAAHNLTPAPKLDKFDPGMVSSDEYLFSSLYE